MAVYLAGMGLVVPSAMSSALALYPRFAGTASACLGFVQMALSACASYAVGHIQDFTEMPMKFVFFAMTAVSILALYGLALRPTRIGPP